MREYALDDGTRLNVLAEGRLVNLAAPVALGHPVEVMDQSFGVQAVSERLRRRLGSGSAWVGLVLAVCIAADAFTRAGEPLDHPARRPRDLGAPAELVAFLRERAGPWRTFVESPSVVPHRRLRSKLGMMNGLFAVPDYEPSPPAAYRAYFDPIRVQPWHGDLSVTRRRTTRSAAALARLLDLMSVRYYATLAAAPPETLAALRDFAGGREYRLPHARVFERLQALPRAYVVHEVIVEPDVEASVARVTSPSFRPREQAVVGDPGASPGDFGSLASALRRPGGAGTAKIESYAAHRVEIAAECDRRCLLVLTDLHHPDWVARVDGRPAAVHRVNALFRGLVLERGAHRISYRLEPTGFRVGCAMLAASLGLLAATALWSRKRRPGS